jgi:hypothetical protein
VVVLQPAGFAGPIQKLSFELRGIAPLELILGLNNFIDILPRWGKIIVNIRQFSKPGML